MKINHENTGLIEEWLLLSKQTISLEDEFVRRIYEDVLERRYKLSTTTSKRQRIRAYRLQYDFVRRDLLKILYKQNNYSATDIRAGFVYAIGNPAWKDYVKVGSAIDVRDRLNSYQTSSPLRDYYLIDYYFAHDRIKEEKLLHYKFYEDRLSEWCKISEENIKNFFKSRKKETQIPLREEIN